MAKHAQQTADRAVDPNNEERLKRAVLIKMMRDLRRVTQKQEQTIRYMQGRGAMVPSEPEVLYSSSDVKRLKDAARDYERSQKEYSVQSVEHDADDRDQ